MSLAPSKADLMSAASDEKRVETARKAVEVFTTMIRDLWEPLAQVMTKNRRLTVHPHPSMSFTDGRKIMLRVPLELGGDTEHNKALCGERDEDGAMLCPACYVKDDVVATVAHEVAHVVEGSFTSIDAKVMEKIFDTLLKPRIEAVDASKVDSCKVQVMRSKTAMEVANHCDAWLPMVVNALEDVFVNERMYEARPGFRTSIISTTVRVIEKGFIQLDGSRSEWKDAPKSARAIMVAYAMAAGIDRVIPYLGDDLEEIVHDAELRRTVGEIHGHTTAQERLELSLRTLEILRSHGVCIDDRSIVFAPVKSEPGKGEPCDGEGDGEGGEAADDDDEEGTGKGSSKSKPKDDSADEASDGEDDDDSKGSGSAGDDDEASDGDDDEDDAEGSGSGDEADDDDDDASSDGSADDDDEGDDDHDSEDDADWTHDGSEADDEDQDDEEIGEGDSDDSNDGGSASGRGSAKDVEMEREEAERALKAFMGHGDDDTPASEPTFSEKVETELVKLLMEQQDMFDDPSFNVRKVGLVDFEGIAPRNLPEERAKAPKDGDIAPVLNQLRVIFSENNKMGVQRNLKAGPRLDTAHLYRLKTGDPRLFAKRALPTKRSWAVTIGLDMSGSTGHGVSSVIKNGGYAMAELLTRLGIPFSVYGHSGSYSAGYGSPMQLDMFHVKRFEEQWDQAAKDRCLKLRGALANLDGHTLEFYRRDIEARHEKDKLIMYFTDGEMPCENYAEELAFLQKNILRCQERKIHLVGVGVGTDSPKAHGLDTIRYDSIKMLPELIKGLGERLTR